MEEQVTTTQQQNMQNNVGGVSANTFMIPILAVIAVIHVIIVALILMTNATGAELSKTMRNSGEYINDATSLLAGSSLMSETSSNFVLMPVTKTGAINYEPLVAYANELSVPRRGQQVLERFRNYEVSETTLSHLSTAAADADKMMQAQLHAISLVRAVYPLPAIAPLTNIPMVELTDAEKAMSDQEKLATAETTILNPVYAMSKQSVSYNVNTAAKIIRENSEQTAAAVGNRLFFLRAALWVATIAVILILALTFLTFYKQLITPLTRFVRLIMSDKSLDENRGMHEVRMVASAYNNVRKRRNALDNILRSAAETDTLTNLANRYRFERFLLDCAEKGGALAILMFDVNFLKRTNDKQGHRAGDDLLRRAAKCISTSFGDNCFRIGGDEFAAVVSDCSQERLQAMLRDFKEAEKLEDVSISVGYAYADKVSEVSIKRLVDDADKRMYEDKKMLHEKLLAQM